MYALFDFFIKGIRHIVNILNIKMFPDFPVTYLQLLCSAVVISALFKFVFGGLKEFDTINNGFLFNSAKSVSKKIENSKREKQINEQKRSIINGEVNGYRPQHQYHPLHEGSTAKYKPRHNSKG